MLNFVDSTVSNWPRLTLAGGPVEVPDRRARTLAVRWLVDFARSRGEYSMSERLANEILDAKRQQGNAWKRKDDIFRMAQANKAFAHYRW